jgi:N-acetylmuramoyl-L-alanine amidase
VPAGHVLVLPAGGGEPRAIAALEADGMVYIAAADVAALLRATRYWRPETRKLLLRVADHRVRLGVDNPFWVIDDATYKLAPPRFERGRVWMPVGFFEFAANLGVIGEAAWNPDARILTLGAGSHSVGAVSIEEHGGATRLAIEVRQGTRPSVLSRSPDQFVVRFPGAVARPSVLGRVQTLGRFERIEILQGGDGVSVHMRVSAGSRGYAIRSQLDPSRVEILVSDQWGRHGGVTYQPFDFEVEEELELPGDEEVDDEQATPGSATHVVIDPGHGGEDAGSQSAGGQLEKHLTLELARRLERRLEAEGLRVTLVRDRDERVDVPRRVELANGLGADIFLSLHCDLNGPLAQGGYIAVARGGGAGHIQYEDLSPVEGIGSTDARDVLSLARWESVGSEFAYEAFQLARSIADHLETAFPDARGDAVTRPVWNLEGARMPAVMLELGALDRESGDPGERMARGSFLNAVVDAIASGVGDALAPPLGSTGERGAKLQGERF